MEEEEGLELVSEKFLAEVGMGQARDFEEKRSEAAMVAKRALSHFAAAQARD
jgi:hypothetical protein